VPRIRALQVLVVRVRLGQVRLRRAAVNELAQAGQQVGAAQPDEPGDQLGDQRGQGGEVATAVELIQCTML
jgi:hypothetical protein